MTLPAALNEIERFDPTRPLAEATTPPSSWYTRSEMYEAEQATVFRKNWLIAARSEQVSRPGTFVTGESAGERFVVTRDEQGTLHAMVNVCRHRATGVARGCGEASKLTCPYHGWSYGLDGRLISAPELGGVKGFVREASGLIPLRVVEWGPLIFAARADTPRELAEDLAPLGQRLEPGGWAAMRFVTRRTWDIGCNWKVFVDNYLDGGYHVPFLHKGLASQLDLDSYRTEIFGRFSLQSTSGIGAGRGGGEAANRGGADFSERIGKGALYAWIYPTLMINRYGPIMDTNWVVPIDHRSTRVHIDYYFEETEGGKDASFIERSLEASDAVQREDIEICESVQQGLSSTSFDSGRYSVTRQAGEHHFHGLLASDLRSIAGS
jgi:choline monooxygenase